MEIEIDKSKLSETQLEEVVKLQKEWDELQAKIDKDFEELEAKPLYKAVCSVVTSIAIRIPAGISMVILAVIASKIFGKDRVVNAFKELAEHKKLRKGE